MAFKFKIPKKVGSKNVMIFTRQFAVMVKAGVPIVRCLEILSEQTPSKLFKEMIKTITHDVESGSTLSEAMGKHRPPFDSLYISMVKAGEAGGVLDKTLLRVADHLEKNESLKGKIKGACTYPAVIFIVAISAAVFMLTCIIPTFAQLFAGSGAELPAITRAVIGLSNFLKKYWILIIFVIVGIIVAINLYSKTKQGKYKIDAFILNMFLFGPLILKAAIARFSRTLSTLTSSGVPVLAGLEITATTAGNMVIERAVLKARQSISEGKTIYEPLRESKIFPPLVTDLIRVGEESGNIAEMLEKVADFYDDEVDTAVATLTSLIEPVTIIFLGGIVGVLLLAMYMPMFQLASVVK
ncbi:MAG: type II secretion system F family protein [bacterium]|nr:type II secretion system F family protein [bacterium]